MKNAAHLRLQIADSLSARIPAAFSPRTRTTPERLPCGIPSLNQLMQGGLIVGALTEFVGDECSGRTTAALACLATVTQTGKVAAWIDTADVLDPESVSANGVDLERLLWVRCGLVQQKSPEVIPSVRTGTVQSATGAPLQPRHTGGGSPHPRSEGRDMPEAIDALLQAHGGIYDGQLRRERKSIGTPGAPNRLLASRPEHREEQVNSDRQPPRRGDNLAIAPRCAEPQPRRIANIPDSKTLPRHRPTQKEPARIDSIQSGGNARSRPWQALDQAIRATDLLLQSGGFSAIVLDLGSIPPEIAWRIPLATWFRFRAACERTRTSLLLLTQHPCSRSSAELVIRLQAGSMEAHSKVMTGIRYGAATERSRSDQSADRVIPIRKPPQSERSNPEQYGQWTSGAAWA